MPDVLSKLPEFKWRGKLYPLDTVGWLRRWETTANQTTSCQYIQDRGPTNWLFSYTIPFRNGIAAKQYGDNLFSRVIELRDDCENRERGPLNDPVWGEWQCVATEFRGDIDKTRRDGCDIQVEFLYKPKINEEDEHAGGLATIGQLASAAATADAEVQKAFYEREQPPPEGGADLLSGIAGIGRQIERQGDKVSQALHKFARRCEAIEDAVKRLEDPKLNELRIAIRRNRAMALRLTKRVNNALRDTKRLVLRYNKEALTLAKEAGMSIQELLQLNPSLAKTPIVPQGTMVTLYRK